MQRGACENPCAAEAGLSSSTTVTAGPAPPAQPRPPAPLGRPTRSIISWKCTDTRAISRFWWYVELWMSSDTLFRRSCLARLPKTKSIASMTLDLPLPLGPTTEEKHCRRGRRGGQLGVRWLQRGRRRGRLPRGGLPGVAQGLLHRGVGLLQPRCTPLQPPSPCHRPMASCLVERPHALRAGVALEVLQHHLLDHKAPGGLCARWPHHCAWLPQGLGMQGERDEPAGRPWEELRISRKCCAVLHPPRHQRRLHHSQPSAACTHSPFEGASEGAPAPPLTRPHHFQPGAAHGRGRP